jgi:hypothetical protein
VPTRLASLSRRFTVLLLVGALAALVLPSFSSVAGAQSNYPLTNTIIVTDADGHVVSGTDAVVVGQPLTVTADGWLPSTDVTMTFDCGRGAPIALGTFAANEVGVVREHFNVPLSEGHCGLHLSGLGTNGNPRAVEAPILVKGAAVTRVAGATRDATPAGAVAAEHGSAFARTGANLWTLLAFAFALFSVGATLVLAVRRKRLRHAFI